MKKTFIVIWVFVRLIFLFLQLSLIGFSNGRTSIGLLLDKIDLFLCLLTLILIILSFFTKNNKINWSAFVFATVDYILFTGMSVAFINDVFWVFLLMLNIILLYGIIFMYKTLIGNVSIGNLNEKAKRTDRQFETEN
jgi:hypothetical protein